MDDERPSLDWPQPLPREEATPKTVKGLQTAAEEVGMALSTISSATRAAFTDLCASAWEGSPSPLHSLRHLGRLLSSMEDADRYSFAAMALRERERFRQLFRVLGVSPFLASPIIDGEWFAMLSADIAEEHASTIPSERFWKRFPEALTMDESKQWKVLRQWHWRETLFLAWRDLIERKEVGALTKDISVLADSSIELALELVSARLVVKHGGQWPLPMEHQLCVLSMGKLGGQELNYRSDIDLVFLYDDDCPRVGKLDAQTFYPKIVSGLMKALSNVNEYGFLYRTDARLRPDGARGALVKNYSSTLQYYRTRGNTWERQAMLKVRSTAGNIELGRRFIEALQPWIFRRFLGVRAVKEIKGLKRQIEARADAKDDTYRDVKTGFGGIRDIEFIVQFLQLLHGGRIPQIRTGNTLLALRLLEKHGLLREDESLHFAQAYAFLRRVEHMLQLEQGVQTHRLPESPQEFELLALRLGYHAEGAESASEIFHRDLDQTAHRTREYLLLLFNDLFSDSEGREAEIEILLDRDSKEAAIQRVLEGVGFSDVQAAWKRILVMAKERPAHKRFEARVRAYLASALPGLLDFVKASPDPDMTLANFERITSGLGSKGVFYELVANRAEMLRIFGALCAYSTRLVDIIQRRSGLLDEFLEVIRFDREHDLDSLRAEVEVRSLAAMSFAEGASWTHDLEMLRIGLYDVSGRSSTSTTMQGLATLARAIVGHGTKHALSQTLEKYPEWQERKTQLFDQFVIVALGKFGAGAMNYESDLDMLFVHGGSAAETPFYESAAKLLRKELSPLYQVDLRLRPMGKGGTLVNTLPALAEYFQGKARFWERLALTRARVVVNAEHEIGSHVQDIIENFVYHSPLPSDAAAQVRKMREEMAQQAGKIDLKRGVGGLLDFEMSVEYLQLLHGRDDPTLRSADVIEASQAMIAAGLDASSQLAQAQSAYQVIRRVIKRTQLSRLSLGALSNQDASAERLARMLGYPSVEEAQQAIEEAKSTLRAHYLATVGE